MGSSRHPTRQALESFVLGRLEPTETRGVVRHLLTGCEECRRVTGELWPVPRGVVADGRQIDGMFRRVAVRIRSRHRHVRRERDEVDVLWDELQHLPASRQLLLALNSRRFHNWFLTEKVLEVAVETGFDDPGHALELAELGVALADRLSEERYGARLINDLRARAWAVLGNARRINSRLREAEQAFTTGEAALREGTGDPLEEARFLTWWARLRTAERRFTESLRLHDRAIAIYRRTGDSHLMGRTLIDRATCHHLAGQLDRAIASTEEGLEHLDPARDPRMALAAKHNLSLYHHEDGDVDRAIRLLNEILPLYAQQNDAMVLLRLRWLEGRLAQAQRQFSRAEEAFDEVCRGFASREMPYDAAAASLDLAAVYLEQGRWSELAERAAEMVSIFRSLGISREALAALQLFKRAAEGQELSVRWIANLATYLERARVRPGLRFQPGDGDS